MKKLILTAGLLSFFWSSALKAQNTAEDKPLKKLTFEEANFVSSYYSQKGNNAAVTGGIGSEKLTDVGGSFNVAFSMFDKKQRKNTFTIDAAIERYSSASSDQIDPSTISSASSSDVHFYPSLVWSRKNEKTGNTFGLNAAYSTEFDYKSYGGGMFYTKTAKDNNSEFTAKLNLFFDKWKVILPVELRPEGYPTGAEEDSEGIPYKPRNSYNLSLSYSKVINPNFQILLMLDPSYQEGLLSTPFHRVYFNDNSLRVEKLPGKRLKLPASIRGNYFVNDRLVLRSMYRFYADDWGLTAHTANLETVFKVNPFFSITPHYRFNGQSGIDYFAPHSENSPDAAFYSSDFDLSKFTSHFAGVGLRVSTPGGVFGISGWNSMELKYGFYNRSTGLQAHILSLGIQVK
jgi:hypothetical protein